MRPLEKMTFEAMIKKLRVRFNGLQREGAEGNYEYDLSDILMSGGSPLLFSRPVVVSLSRTDAEEVRAD